jgi:hypothetical protein
MTVWADASAALATVSSVDENIVRCRCVCCRGLAKGPRYQLTKTRTRRRIHTLLGVQFEETKARGGKEWVAGQQEVISLMASSAVAIPPSPAAQPFVTSIHVIRLGMAMAIPTSSHSPLFATINSYYLILI